MKKIVASLKKIAQTVLTVWFYFDPKVRALIVTAAAGVAVQKITGVIHDPTTAALAIAVIGSVAAYLKKNSASADRKSLAHELAGEDTELTP